MIIKPVFWFVVIVGLPDANYNFVPTSKLDYTVPYDTCQQRKNKNTMEFNYITNEEVIESNIQKYQELLW